MSKKYGFGETSVEAQAESVLSALEADRLLGERIRAIVDELGDVAIARMTTWYLVRTDIYDTENRRRDDGGHTLDEAVEAFHKGLKQ